METHEAQRPSLRNSGIIRTGRPGRTKCSRGVRHTITVDKSRRILQSIFLVDEYTLRRFLSRCKVLEFSSYGLAGEIAANLNRVWHAEGGNGNAPDFERLAKDSRNNVRDCLMRLEVELMAL